MKKLIVSIAIAVSFITANAQTIPQDAFNLASDTLAGPWGVAGGIGKNLNGNGVAAFGIVTYNLVLSTNGMGFNSGPVMGYDITWLPHAKGQIYSLSGGWDASYTGKPFSFVGKTFVTNITASATAFQLVATPRGGSAIGAITGTAVTLDVYSFYNFHIKPIGIYESRNGMNEGSGNWLFGGLAVTHAF